MAAKMHQDDDVVECSICRDVFNDPRILPCVHSYCSKCIADWCKEEQAQPGDKVACPLCRQQFSIPDGGVDHLPKNAFLGKLSQISEMTKKNGSKVKLCDICSSDDQEATDERSAAKKAEVFCCECRQSLCKSCNKVHCKLNAGSTHSVITLEEFDGEDINAKISSIFCDKHRNEVTKIYCFDCNTTLCMLCFAKEHNAHKISEVVEVASDFRTGLTEDIQKMRDVMNRFDEKLEVVASQRALFTEQVKNAEKEIDARVDHIKKMIDEEKQKVIADLCEVQTQNEKYLGGAMEEFSQGKSMLKSLETYSTELLKKGTDCDITRQGNSIRTRASDLNNPEIIDGVIDKLRVCKVSFLPSADNLCDDAKNIGKVVKEFEIFPGTRPGTPKLAFSLAGPHEVSAIALLDQQLFFTRFNEYPVYVLDKTTLQSQGALTCFMSSPYKWGLATCIVKKYLYVSDNTNSCVYRFDLPGTAVATQWAVIDKPRALSVTRAQNVLVTSGDSQLVQEYTCNGTLLRQISDSNHIWQTVELSSGLLAVSRSWPACGIFTVAKDDQVIKSYQVDSGVGKMNVPRSMALDEYGFILVADEMNNRILVVNPSLTDARPLPLPAGIALQRPLSLCLDQECGRLYVGEYTGQNRLLVFDDVINVGGLFNT